jgi:hypothetical protein
MMGDASGAAERVRLQNEVYKIIEYVESHGDLPHDAAGRFDPSAILAKEDVNALVFNPLLTAVAITNPRELEVLAATSPALAEPDFEDAEMCFVQFIMTDGSSFGRRVDPHKYSEWCELFTALHNDSCLRFCSDPSHRVSRAPVHGQARFVTDSISSV